MDYSRLLQTFLDISEEMLVAGAEVSRVEDSLERLCAAYGFSPDRTNAFIITSNIQLAAEAPDGSIHTQIRRVLRSEINYDRLDYLNDLCRAACAELPDEKELRRRYEEVMARPKLKLPFAFLGRFLACGGFAVFFGGSLLDGLGAGLAGMALAQFLKFIGKYDNNELSKAFAGAIFSGIAALLMGLLGLHIDKIMIGCIMILIPGISLTNAVRDMLTGDLASGLLRLVNSLLVSVVIASGFALTHLLVGQQFIDLHSGAWDTSGSLWLTYTVQLLSAAAGSLGFALFFNMRGRQVFYAALAGTATWAVYLLADARGIGGVFVCNLIASIFVGLIAERLAVINKAPATIFLTAAAIPLIPGGALYYTMAGLVYSDLDAFEQYGRSCIMIALAISLGFFIVTMLNKYRVLFRKQGVK